MNTHAFTQSLLPLEEPAPDGRIFFNAALWFVDSDGYRVIFHWHEPIYRVALTDEVHLRLVAVTLRQSRLATQEEICRAFGHGVSTQARWERHYNKHGVDGLVSKKRTGRHRELDRSQEGFVRKWFRAGRSNRAIAKRLGVDESTIRRTLKRLALTRKPAVLSPMLPGMEDEAADTATTAAIASAPAAAAESGDDVPAETLSPDEVCSAPSLERSRQDAPVSIEPSATPSFTLDHDPHDRSGDRVLARVGLLDDAVPLFADAQCVPRAGVLLAVPLLVDHGLIEAFVKVYGSLRPSFYGLRTIVVTLFLAALLRIKRPEHFKEHRPEDLGAILGLDRAPEVKTVRRKFARLAAMDRGKQLMDELARRRIAENEDRVAFLYVDGHVREYHGKYPLFRAKKAQRQVVTPAATDTWVHTADGEPLLVVTSEVNAKLTQVLEPILADVRRLVGDQRRMTVIFDRGGFSPKLFGRLIDAGFDVITYRKGKVKKLASTRFAAEKQKIDGVWQEYTICDRSRVRVGTLPTEKTQRRKRGKAKKRYLWMREVRVLRDDGRQTPIFTNRQDLSAAMVAYRIFSRWRQENYFKYMAEEFALDALIEYGAEDVPETTDCRNPHWLRLTRRVKEARAEVKRLQSKLGKEAEANREATRRTMRGFKIVHAGLREQLQKAEAKVERLLQQRKKIPPRVPASDRKMLKTEKKLIADTIKMAAYQVETQLLGMLQGHYARADEEGRTLLHAAFQSPAHLEVADGELRVTIAAQSSPHRTAALSALCEQLDALAIPFPGTHLRLRLAVQAPEPVI
ncbi:MAG: helix-turn-helix domain-containing protein [Gemmatimonadetes bacterium]|nr:helix-turn-helix domain-containing protein [Gemmatimonadota bacterium]